MIFPPILPNIGTPPLGAETGGGEEYPVDCCCKAIWQGNPLTSDHPWGQRQATPLAGVVRGTVGSAGGYGHQEWMAIGFKQVCIKKELGPMNERRCPEMDPMIQAFIDTHKKQGWKVEDISRGGEDCTTPKCCPRASPSAFLPSPTSSRDCCPWRTFLFTKPI